jgi:hypothetical protein
MYVIDKGFQDLRGPLGSPQIALPNARLVELLGNQGTIDAFDLRNSGSLQFHGGTWYDYRFDMKLSSLSKKNEEYFSRMVSIELQTDSTSSVQGLDTPPPPVYHNLRKPRGLSHMS